ncbi:GntR family transcriptional regulator [Fictibacillus terranigra]|uniref:GntR family transcriptional regulator n=1 Tax=Fictibacillus terranigra TaxID=3058424 RepID=A0ABT8E4W2_9BACL|nr:GntR family transcriptional regulator [Fictibacillus sp. CENA-BCM004]MDN4072945.1 GntR family transcriptional regulator [Fictibacillus sp. CENA-BCM004]
MKSNLSTRDQVYTDLKEQILILQLTPGTGISEKEISLQFNVSRTPVREAFLRLAQEGLVDVYPQRGTFVSLIDLESVEEARFMREHVERAVIRLACHYLTQENLMELETNVSFQKKCIKEKDFKRMFELDEEFHHMIFEGCNKSKTWSVIQQMNLDFNRSRLLRLVADHNWDHILKQHVQILEAIRKKDADLAEKLMEDHLMLAVIDKQLLKVHYPNYFK